MSSSVQHIEMPRSVTRKILAVTRELLLPELVYGCPNALRWTFAFSFLAGVIIILGTTHPDAPRTFLELFWTSVGLSALPVMMISSSSMAVFLAFSMIEICLWLLIQAYFVAMPIIWRSKQLFVTNGDKLDTQDRSRPEWLIKLSYEFEDMSQRQCPETVKLGTEICGCFVVSTIAIPKVVFVAPQGQENHLREWEHDLVARENHLRRKEDDLREWSNDLHDRDDKLQEWDEYWQRILDKLRNQAERIRDGEWQNTMQECFEMLREWEGDL